MILTLGIDPGASGGVALCACEAERKPLLLGAWSVTGEDLYDYTMSAFRALQAAQTLLGGLPVEVWIEEVPAYGRAQVAAGIARRQGVLLAVLAVSGWHARRVLPGFWWDVYGSQIRRGKDKNDDSHRLVEALTVLNGAEQLRGMPVDVVEAALIAGACGLRRLGVVPLVAVPAVRKPRKKKVEK